MKLKPQFDVTVKGVALGNYGLTEWQTVSGEGLLTYGLVWPCTSIWYGPITSTGATLISTSWTMLSLPTTSWTPYAGVTTVWIEVSTNNIELC